MSDSAAVTFPAWSKEEALADLRRQLAARFVGDLLRGPFAFFQDKPDECANKAVELADALLERLRR